MSANKDRLSYERWMELVNAYCVRRVGVSVYEFSDRLYRDWYDDGMGAREAADRAICEEMAEMGM